MRRISPGIRVLLLLLPVVALSACKSSGSDTSNTREPSYQSARTLPPLEVPPDLSQFPPSAEYALPTTEQRQSSADEADGSIPPISDDIASAGPGFDQPSGGTAFGDDAPGTEAGGLAGVREPDAPDEVMDFDVADMTASLEASDEQGPYLAVNAPFHIIWQQLGLGLDREEVSILDRDRTNGRYYIDCEAIEETVEGEKKRRGWFFGFGKEREREITEICLLNVAMEDGGQGDLVVEDSPMTGDIFVTTEAGDNIDPELANQFLERILRHFG